MKCPNCGVEAPVGASECAACGVIFAKFLKKLEELKAPEPRKVNLWKGRTIAFAFLVIWFIALSLYYQRRLAVLRATYPPGPARGR